MIYLSKENDRKKRTISGIIRGLTSGIVTGGIVGALMFNLNLNDIWRIGVPAGIGVVVFVIYYFSSKSLTRQKFEIMARQERLLAFDFDHEMEKYQIGKNVKQFENEDWFIDRTSSSILKDTWVYHVDFIRKVDGDEVVFITGEVLLLPDPIRFHFVDWLKESKAKRPSVSEVERIPDQPYAPFVIEESAGKYTLVYEISGFKAGYFESIDKYDETIRGDIYDWESLVVTYLKLKASHLAEKIGFNSDYTESILRLTATDSSILEEFAKGFRDMCDDTAALMQLLHYDDVADED